LGRYGQRLLAEFRPGIRHRRQIFIAFKLGFGKAGTDYTLTFDGETNDGILTWMEDEDYFKFCDDVLMESTENIYFRDTSIGIHSEEDGHLDVTADVSIDLNSSVVINEDGEDHDTRIEGNNNANLFFVDAGNDRI